MNDFSAQNPCCSLQFDFSHAVLLHTWHGDLNDNALVEGHELGQKGIAKYKPRAIVSDFSQVTAFNVSPQCIEGLAMQDPVALRDQPLVLVAAEDHIYGMARMYEILNDSRRVGLTVVHTLAEAFAIIKLEDPQFEPVQLA